MRKGLWTVFSHDAIGRRPREGRWKAAGRRVTCTKPTFGSRVHTRTTPALGEHLRHLPRIRAERYTGHKLPGAKGDDIFEEGAGRLA